MAALWVVPEELESGGGSPYAYEACKAASYILWAFSGRKYHGTRTVTERYECPCSSSTRRSNVVPGPLGGVGNIYDHTLDVLDTTAGGGCGCTGTIGGRHMRLRLRGTPVRHVSQVKKGDTVLDASQYKIVNGSTLQLTNTSMDVCGLEISYTYGVTVPVSGQRAARSMAQEFVKGWSGEECLLPDRVTNVSREGISFTIMDKQDFLDEGRTGIYEVDLFLRATNPDKARKPARIFSPDKPKAYRVTSGQVSAVLGPLDWRISPGEISSWSVDLVANNADLLLDSSWNPQGQIATWNGTTVLEFTPDRFQITGNILTVTLTADESSQLSGKTAMWDLYGISAADGYTIVHVLSSTIHIAGDD